MSMRALCFRKSFEQIFVKVYLRNRNPYPTKPLLREHLEDRFFQLVITINSGHRHIAPRVIEKIFAMPKISWRTEYEEQSGQKLTLIEADEVITDITLSRFPGHGHTGCDVVAFHVRAIGRRFPYEIPVVIDHNKSNAT